MQLGFEDNIGGNMQEIDIISVADYNRLLNGIFSDLPELVIEGEITEIKFSRGNSAFITLKDMSGNEVAAINNYAPIIEGLRGVSEGMRVLAYGRPEIYAPRGSLSFKARKLEPVGEGSLKLAFEQLKQKLNNEGLFEITRKRSIRPPIFRIALLTGAESAAFADFTKILKEHNSGIIVDYYPVTVQGPNAVKSISSALKVTFSKIAVDQDYYSAIVLSRGGGSLEDLKSFNDESIARQVFGAPVPVVSAVGHESDTSIVDMVADIRASTPSQAAYYLAELNTEVLQNIERNRIEQEQKIISQLPREDQLQNLLQKWENQILTNLPDAANLNRTIENIRQKLIRRSPKLSDYQHMFDRLNRSGKFLTEEISQISSEIQQNKQQNFEKITNVIESYDSKLNSATKLLSSYNPRGVLTRGYSLIQQKGKYISKGKDINSNENFEIELQDGKITAKKVKK